MRRDLSPVLFSIYLNDLEQFLDKPDIGIHFECYNDYLSTFFKLIALLYADDTELIADNEKAIQNTLDMFNEYCKSWKLKVNINKTKVIVFGAIKTDNMVFRLGDNTVEVTDRYKYLGVFFFKSHSFLNCTNMLWSKLEKLCTSYFVELITFISR